MANAKLIVLESLDGGGKSTQINLIKKYLDQTNIKHEHIHFPIYGNNEASSVIAAYLRGEYGDINNVNPIFVANIFAMDRFLYLPTFEKQLIENDVVLLDRYVFSNMAYQGAKYLNETQSQMMRNWISDLEFKFLELPYPNLNIFLDVPIDIIKERLELTRKGDDREYLKGKTDIHENDIEFQIRVKNNYLSLKDYSNFKVIETGSLSPEDVFNKYKSELDLIIK